MNNNPHGPGFVYLMRSGGEYKIGSSTDPEVRRRQFEVSSGVRFELLWSFRAADAFILELAIQQRFRTKKIRLREWFNLSAADLAWLYAFGAEQADAVLAAYRPYGTRKGRIVPRRVAPTVKGKGGYTAEDLTGREFERLTVVRLVGRRPADRQTVWLCRCACGRKKEVARSGLIRGKVRSCGCLVKVTRHTTHGLSKTPLYRQYRSMVDRCTSPTVAHFRRYGGRGIMVHPDWLGAGGFARFMAHIGPKPEGKFEIDRIDPNGNYEPGNVRWLPHKENCRNREKTRTLMHGGVTKSLSEWAEEFGIPQNVLTYRVVAGWPSWRALSTPVRKARR